MRIALAVVLFAHGFAHFVGFAVPWGLVQSRDAFGTTIAGGLINIGPNGMRAFGIGWLLVTVAFTIAAIMVVAGGIAWKGVVITVVLTSLVMCLVSLPLTTIGLVLNVLILTWISIGGPRGWFV